MIALFPFGLAAQDLASTARKLSAAPPVAHQTVGPGIMSGSSTADEMLLDKLLGIQVVEGMDLPPQKRRGVTLPEDWEGKKRFSSLRRMLENNLGVPLRWSGLQALQKIILQPFRDQGDVLVDVIVPEQDITDGIVVFQVVQGRLGTKRVFGARYFDEKRMLEQIRVGEGGRLNMLSIREDLNWLNRNPFRQVSATFAPGKQPQTSNLLLKVEDELPWRAFAAYENSGTESTGTDRFLGGFHWGNVFNWEHQLNYQFTIAEDTDRLQAHSLSYLIPWPWRHTLTLIGSYSRSKLPDRMFPLHGESWQASLRYEIPLPDWWVFESTLTTGFDIKQSNNDLEFGGSNIFAGRTRIYQFLLELLVKQRDASGVTSLRGQCFYSPGEMDDYNSQARFEESRGGAESRYSYVYLAIERAQLLPYGFSLDARAAYQNATGNLLVSEQLTIGGYNTVRGFVEQAVNGDRGYLASLELRLPQWNVHFGQELTYGDLQGLVFWDWGKVRHRDGPGWFELASAGVGLRYSYARNVSLRFDYGWILQEFPGYPHDSSRGHVSLQIGF